MNAAAASPAIAMTTKTSAGSHSTPNVATTSRFDWQRIVSITDRAGQQGPCDHSNIGHHVDRAVGATQVGIVNQLGNHAVLGGPEERTLTGQSNQSQQGDPEIAGEKPDAGNNRDRESLRS